MADLVQVAGVRDHERAARQVDDVELDEVDTRRDGDAERADGVLRSERRRATVTDAQR